MIILDKITDYHDLRELSYESLELLASDIREKIVDVVSINGGHLGSPMGAVELTISILRQLDPEFDRIIFDVGHQSYPYKLLTGRLDSFDSLRQFGGISGFPKRTESIYDHFDTGHSSTSISAALGFAKARDIKGEKHEVVAVIGDGALLNGLAFEALNYCKESNSKVIIILNDNHMCISPRIGGFATYLARLSSNYTYRNLKELVKRTSYKLPKGKHIENFLKITKEKIKSLLKPENLFDEMGINYWGPFDGHNIVEMEKVIKLAKRYDKPVIIHVLTTKGKGHTKAEESPSLYHGVTPLYAKGTGKSWSAAASEIVENIASRDKNVVCFTAAMKEGNKLNHFAERFPDRFLDVGIAEEHMLTMAAGMAASGMRPFVFIYSTFMQRAMDQLVHDIAMQDLPVVIAVDRAGLIGEDGETHQGILDIAWTKSVPNIEIMAPRDQVDLVLMMDYAYKRSGPSLIRFSRGKINEKLARKGRDPESFDGKCKTIEHGQDWLLIGFGKTVEFLLKTRRSAIENDLPAPTVTDIRSIKPIDWNTIDKLLEVHDLVITAEDGYVSGGIGQSISARCASNDFKCKVINLGVPDFFVPQGTVEQQWELCGLTPENIMVIYDEFKKNKA